MLHSKARGFSLMELMVAVAIVGILAAIALPSYKKYVVRSKRAEAMSALMSAASTMERYRTNNSYSYLSACLLGGSSCTVVFANKVPTDGSGTTTYNLRFDNLTRTAFTLTAEPISGGSQEADGILTLTNTGAKTWGSKSCWPSSGDSC